MSKDNTLLFTLEYPPQIGGVATYYSNVVKHWPSFAKATDDKPFFASFNAKAIDDKNATDDKSSGGIFVLTGKKLTKPHWIFSVFYLWRAIKKYKVKTVLVGHVLPLGTVAYWLSRIIRFDYVVFIHGMELGIINKHARKKKITRKILANAKKVITANNYTGELLKELVDENKIEIVNPGIETRVTHNAQRIAQLREKYNLEGKKILLQVGRLVERKGFDKVIEVLPNVQKEYQNIVYVLVGTGHCPVHTDIKNLICITDADDNEIQAWYELCDIFIMPSRNVDGDFEGFGIVYLEANAHGKPVIAGDSGGVRDAVQNGVNGLLVNPESVEEIKNAIVKLCKDEELRVKLGEQGREWVKKFSWEKQIEKIVKLLNC